MDLMKKSVSELKEYKKELTEKQDGFLTELGRKVAGDPSFSGTAPVREYQEAMADMQEELDLIEFLLEKKAQKVACPKCGQMVRDGALFCEFCGAGISGDEAAMGAFVTETLSEAKTGAEPAAADKICPNCGNHVIPDALFCNECGTKL